MRRHIRFALDHGSAILPTPLARLCLVLAATALFLFASPLASAHATNATHAPDTLTIAVATDAHDLDPASTMDNKDWRLVFPCYERLVAFVPPTAKNAGAGTVQPQAAASWSLSEDGLTWTFRLRPGAHFDSGTPLDAQAVKISLERVLAMGKGPATHLSAIKRIDAPEPLTVRIHLKYPFAPFLQVLATCGASIVDPVALNPADVAPAKDTKPADLSRATHGSGPYRLAEWTPGKQYVLEARPGYSGTPPAFRRVVFRVVPHAAHRRELLARGGVDIAADLTPTQTGKLHETQGVSVQRYASLLVDYVYVNCKRPALEDRRVRQALSHGVDYDGIIRYVLRGQGARIAGTVPAGLWGHRPDALQYDYAPGTSRTLLEDAGRSSGLSLRLLYSDREPRWEQVAAIIQTTLAETGVAVRLEKVSRAEQRARIAKGDFDLCLGSWSPDFADPAMFLNSWYDSANAGIPGNRAFYANDEVDGLLRAALRATSPEDRLGLYDKVQDLVMDDAPYILLYQTYTVEALRADLRGRVYHPMLEGIYNLADMYRQ